MTATPSGLGQWPREKANVSVIVPVYKVEPFVRRCVTSLMEQTLRDVEYIFVDDASPDDSVRVIHEILELYPWRKPQVKIVSHQVNRGLPSARNTGLVMATGKYILHCDSDDYADREMLEQMYALAETENADIVWCDYYLTFHNGDRHMRQPQASTPDKALAAMLAGRLKYNVWNKLARRGLYTANGIVFPDGYGMGEDMTMVRLMACAERVASLPKPFYHYARTNAEAFTGKSAGPQISDIIHNADMTCDFIGRHRPDIGVEELACFQLNVKYGLLMSGDGKNYDLWRHSLSKANRYAGSRHFGLRCRLLQTAALRRWDMLLRLHYWLVYRPVYGLLYR